MSEQRIKTMDYDGVRVRFVDNSLTGCGRSPDCATGASTRLPPTHYDEFQLVAEQFIERSSHEFGEMPGD